MGLRKRQGMLKLVWQAEAVAAAVLWHLAFNVAASNLDSQNSSLIVTNGVWAKLSQQQRDLVSTRYAVEVADIGRFAKIINVQGINESTQGTAGGAQLGAAFGQAQYIDKANWNNYSARSQLGAGLVGALLGSALDAPARTMYRIVYTLKRSDGSVNVIEKVSPSPIYIASGLCIDTVSFKPVNDSLCEDTLPPEIRTIIGLAENPPTPKAGEASSLLMPAPATPVPQAPLGGVVFCRLGSTSSVPTTAEKCLQAGGNIQ